MLTQARKEICEIVVQKLTTGQSLDDAEKSHLAVCENCMAEIIRTLDESATIARNGDLTHARPQARKALEHGRLVFEREFGISLSKD